MFALTWEPLVHGSGVRITWGEGLELDVSLRDWLLKRQNRQRELEAKEYSKKR